MNSSFDRGGEAFLKVRGARASSVIVQRVRPDAVEVFMAWQRGITGAASTFPGYQVTEIYPPANVHDEWVVIVHFDDSGALQAWLDSPARADWLAKRPAEAGHFRLKTLPSGFGPWFAGLTPAGGPLPHWKMILVVLLALYPTVMLLTVLLMPHLQPFGLALALLLSSAASVCFLEFVGTPLIVVLLGRWLRATAKEEPAVLWVGLGLILATLAGMVAAFRLITG